MLILSHLLGATAYVLNMVLSMVMFMVVARALISWVNPDPYNPVVRFLNAFTEPMLAPIRRLVPGLSRGLDLSPVILIFAIYFLQASLVPLLSDYATLMRRAALGG